jgi:hypothetical protein
MNKEKIIQEQRTIEAMKNGYMGLNGKFATIAKKLGYSIVSHGSSDFQQTFLEDFYNLDEQENSLPIMEDDVVFNEIGFTYDKYASGSNLVINLFFTNTAITVNYNGNIVYKEVAGELEYYVPNKDWESKIDSIYNMTLKIEKSNKNNNVKKLNEMANAKKKEILDRLQKKWGI